MKTFLRGMTKYPEFWFRQRDIRVRSYRLLAHMRMWHRITI